MAHLGCVCVVLTEVCLQRWAVVGRGLIAVSP